MTLRSSNTGISLFQLLGNGGVAAGALLLIHAYALFRGLDFRDYDDLVRTLLVRAWVQRPYYMIGDGFWLTLPAIARGAWIKLLPDAVLGYPSLAVELSRLVTLAYLWGCWRLLTNALRMFGGGRAAIGLFTAFFLLNAGTFHFAASNYSEPDTFFWTLLALTTLMGGLSNPQFSGGRILAYGLAMAAACQCRYEAWTFPPILGGFILVMNRRALQPWKRWAGLLLPAVPIVIWLILSRIFQGGAFHFLEISKQYRGVFPVTRMGVLASFLKINPVWIPLAGMLGLAELVRLRKHLVARCFSVSALLILAWGFYRQATNWMTIRFVWDASLMLAVPWSIYLERACFSPLNRLAHRLAVGLLVLSTLCYGWQLSRLHPYIPASFRNFTNAVQQKTADGKILLCDHLEPGQDFFYQAFRVLVVTERFVFSSWIQKNGEIPLDSLKAARIRYVLSRKAPGSLIDGPPILVDADSGWRLWKSR